MRKECCVCQKEYSTLRIKSKVCSRACRTVFEQGVRHPRYIGNLKGVCLVCKNEMIIKRSKPNKKYCSTKCSNKRNLKTKSQKTSDMSTYIKPEPSIKFILPSEAQMIIYGFGLRYYYAKTNFKMYSINDYGKKKFKRQMGFNSIFREKVLRRPYFNYPKKRLLRNDLRNTIGAGFVFFNEEEVLNWVQVTKAFDSSL